MKAKRQLGLKITALSLLGFALLYFFYAMRLKAGTLKNPGPGLIPAAIGALLTLCSGVYLFRVFRKKTGDRKKEGEPSPGEKNYRAIVGIVICTVIYPFLLEPLKFILATFASGFVMLFLLKPKKVLYSVLLSLGLAVGAFLIFSRLFGVAMPSGPLEIFLFRMGG
jgi:putative tricarboxylic transport membrane protein